MQNVNSPAVCEHDCGHSIDFAETKLIVLTGGPGAGKTAVLEIVRKQLCKHVVILPEAASIIFGGGFWRLSSLTAVQAAQRAILHVQQEMESLVLDEKKWLVGLCDRGLLDGMAYWPGGQEDFWKAAQTTLEAEYKRYHAVIHLRTPTDQLGYNRQNPLRIESAIQAAAIDEKIKSIWSAHPRYYEVESSPDFLTKAGKAMAYIMQDLSGCCGHELFPEV